MSRTLVTPIAVRAALALAVALAAPVAACSASAAQAVAQETAYADAGRRVYEWVDRHIPDDGWGGILSQPAAYCTYA